jgi:hypothetical protein
MCWFILHPSSFILAVHGEEHVQQPVVKPLVFDIHARLNESFLQLERLVKELENDKNPMVRLAAAAEIRHHIELTTRALDIATRAEAHREFQAGVLEAPASAKVNVKRHIMGLFEARALGEDEPQP